MANEAELLAAAWDALRSGRAAEAEPFCRRALQSDPVSAEAWFLLGAACHGQGRPAEAADCYARSLPLRPDLPEIHFRLGLALRDLGQFAEAEKCFRQTLAMGPDLPEIHYHLGLVLGRQCRPDEAEECFRRALELRPEYPEALIDLGNALQDRSRLGEAEECFRRALALRTDSAAAILNLGNVLQEQGRPAEAEGCFRRALQLRPDLPGVHYNLGLSLRGQGRLAEAEGCLRRALELGPGYPEVHDALLLTLHYKAGVTPQELAAEHAKYQDRHAAPLRGAWRPFANDRDPERPLRLGFVSPNFGRHPVGFLLVRAVEALARQPCEVYCYSDRRLPADDLTARFQAASLWRGTAGLSDETLAELARADGIDVLIDLAGHTAGNRLLAFARKPAPVQCTWLGYEGTTGLQAVDYLVADECLVPRGAEAHYRERVLRLPGGYACYDPPAGAPEPGPPPALQNGRVTFGCFNNPAKLSDSALATWTELLQRVPESCLLLKYRGLDDPAVGGRLVEQFAARGVRSERVKLRGSAAYADYLAEYRDVDIALDPFPFGGGVTTCDALWMGVPVVTWAGDTYASRHGFSHVTAVGLAELAAADAEGYVARAAGLAQDLSRLAELRACLRARVARAPLCDGQRLANELLAALRGAWLAWAAAAGS